MTYPGGKNGAGTYQKLINLIPPHNTYIETHLGGGAVMLNKRPAAFNFGVDIDPDVVKNWQSKKYPNMFIYEKDAVAFLTDYAFSGREMVYCDPPYVMDTRKSKRKLYAFEYSQDDHVRLLETIKTLPCYVMISGYRSALYEDYLSDWTVYSFQVQTRGGRPATEYVWTNYDEPVRLHEYTFLGDDFRERERIKRKKNRWVNRLARLPLLERRALLHAIELSWPDRSLD